LAFDPSVYVPCGRWVTPHFSRARFDTNFFFVELEAPGEPDVWPGELESGEWVEPSRALRLWEDDQVVLAMPTLHAIRVLAEGRRGRGRPPPPGSPGGRGGGAGAVRDPGLGAPARPGPRADRSGAPRGRHHRSGRAPPAAGARARDARPLALASRLLRGDLED